MKRKILSALMLSVLMMATALLPACSNGGQSTKSDQTQAAEVKESAATTAGGAAASEPAAQAGNAAEKTDAYPAPRVVKDKPLKVGYLHATLDVESRIRTFHQVEIETAHRGWQLVDATTTDEQSQRDAMQNLINQNVDAILIGSMSMEPLTDLIIQARQKGIGVYNTDTQLVDGCIMNSTMPNAVAATTIFYDAGNELKWKGNICVITIRSIQVHPERTDPIQSLCGVGKAYPGLKVLDEQNVDVGKGGLVQQAYDITKAWIQKYGSDIDLIVCSWDDAAIGASEAIKASGAHMKTFCISVDGGSQSWAYVRNGTAFKYDYCQPFELYTHKSFEVMQQLQIENIQPGDKGSILPSYGSVLYSNGLVVGPETVPNVGESVHAVFDYYGGKADDKEAWYNWSDKGGPYVITDGTS